MKKRGKNRGGSKRIPNGSRISSRVLDELMSDYQGPADLIGQDGLLRELMAALINRAMGAELTHHLGYGAGETPPEEEGNRRNGTRSKKVRTKQGELEIDVPRDREGSFEPQIVPKHQRHFDGFDEQIIAMYARGMSVRDIRSHLEEIYGVDVSASLISEVTDAVLDELRMWQCRPLDSVYPIVYLDALVTKIRDKGVVANKSIYLALGVTTEGEKRVLGMWVQKTEGARFWTAIMTELRHRGVEDILVMCADGLKGMPEAVEAVFPQTIFQTCIIHLMRFVPWKDRRAVCADLREIYTAVDIEAAKEAMDQFEAKWGQKFPMIVKSWRERWDEFTPFLAFPAEIRRAIYTTNAIESFNRQVRKALKTRGHLPTDDAAMKLIFLVIRQAEKNGFNRNRDWFRMKLQFSIYFEGRFPA